VAGAGLPTPRYVRIAPGGDLAAAALRALGLPVFVKPSTRAPASACSSESEDDLAPAVAFASAYAGELLMEQMVTGGEFTVGILGDVALPSIRIVPGQSGTTTTPSTSPTIPSTCARAWTRPTTRPEIRTLALAAFRAAGCSGWGRVDVMRDAERPLPADEVNTAPGMTSHSLVPKAAAQVGIGFEALCWRILEQTLPEVAGP
jgi:D-alanine-D-alanine ligase